MAATAPHPDTDGALRSVHTANLPDLFERLGISLVLSTYQAGKAILVRKDGGSLQSSNEMLALRRARVRGQQGLGALLLALTQ